MLVADTKYREGEGGINSEITTNRRQREIDAVQAMVKEWPSCFKLNKDLPLASGLPMEVGTRLNNSFQRLNNLIGFGILTKFSQFFQNFLQLSANFDIF